MIGQVRDRRANPVRATHVLVLPLSPDSSQSFIVACECDLSGRVRESLSRDCHANRAIAHFAIAATDDIHVCPVVPVVIVGDRCAGASQMQYDIVNALVPLLNSIGETNPDEPIRVETNAVSAHLQSH